MTDLESRLRAALEEAAPVGVDTSSLADRARASARRTRRRTSGAVAASLVAVVLPRRGHVLGPEGADGDPSRAPVAHRECPGSLCRTRPAVA